MAYTVDKVSVEIDFRAEDARGPVHVVFDFVPVTDAEIELARQLLAKNDAINLAAAMREGPAGNLDDISA